MKNRIRQACRVAMLTGVLASGFWTSRAAGQSAGSLVMVVNKGNPASITKEDAKKMLLGQTLAWPGGQRVVLVMGPPKNSDRVKVLTKLCGMSEVQYTRYQMQAVFTGKVPARVQEAATPEDVKSFVKANPAAVGFVNAGDVDKDLKVVLQVE